MQNDLLEQGNIGLSYQFLLEQKLPKDFKILELGAHYGSLNNALYKQGYKNVWSIDINEAAVEEGKRLYKAISPRLSVGDAQDLSAFEDNSVDVVMSFDVIEHLPHVDKHFKEVTRVLKPGGKYIFQTPHKFFNTIWCTVVDKSFTTWREEHCSLQNHSSLKKLAKKNGLKREYLGKYKILNEYNSAKIARRAGKLVIPVVKFIENAPGNISTNIWGVFVKA